ncbi:MAG: chalcone isomerase family protein [Bacteroidota bacterium]|jgi:hypothetical protein
MKNIFIALSFLPLFCFSQVKIEGVTFPANIRSGDNNLILNGGGVREKYFMDMYVGALYLKSKNKDASSIIKSGEAMAIRLHIVSSLISSEKMISAIDEGFQKSTGGKTAPLDSKIKQFKAAFSEKIKVGDVFEIINDPSKGVCIYKNSKSISVIPGIDFKSALFGIWLCDKPADSDLKEKMLGL